jgi:hypothetical protein
VHPASRIDAPAAHARITPGEVTVRGYAWAPPVGVEAVQLQIDGGAWTDADLGVDLGPGAWALRACVLNPRSSPADMQAIVDSVLSAAAVEGA